MGRAYVLQLLDTQQELSIWEGQGGGGCGSKGWVGGGAYVLQLLDMQQQLFIVGLISLNDLRQAPVLIL